MSPSLSSLPDLCLLEVFKNFHLLELLRTIRLVNTRWSKLQIAEMNRRRSLVIVDDRHFNLLDLQLDQYGCRLIEHVRRDDALTPWARLPHIDHRNLVNRNHLIHDFSKHPLQNHLSPEIITTLIDCLPRISSLTIVQRFVVVSSLNQIVRMIDHWRENLISLKLCLDYELSVRTIPDQFAQLKSLSIELINSINRLPSLKHLKLNLSFYRTYEPQLTILSQLSSFDFYGRMSNDTLSQSLVRYASENGNLSQISVGFISVGQLLQVKPEFCSKFCRINLDDSRETMHSMDRFCTRFTSLVHLSLHLHEMSITMLSRCLCKLTQLVHLSLQVSGYHPEQEFQPDQTLPVPTVRLLTLRLIITFHSSTERLHLPEVFPNVQALSITHIGERCADCDYEEHGQMVDRDFDQVQLQIRECARIVRRPFRRFPKLHTIKIDVNDSFYCSVLKEKRLITRDEL